VGTLSFVMFTLLVGILIVAASTAGFGFALFGRRPVPQPAMELATTPLGTTDAEPPPSSSDRGELLAGAPGDTITDEDVPRGRRARDVTITPWVRLRSVLLLVLTVVGLAGIFGAVLSIVVVGIVFIAT